MSAIDLDAAPKVMGDDGEFHAVDEAVDLSGTPVEGWLALVLFWALGATVFTQFFTRYGKIGTDGQMTQKDWDSNEKAQAEANKLIAEKTKKGYVEK